MCLQFYSSVFTILQHMVIKLTHYPLCQSKHKQKPSKLETSGKKKRNSVVPVLYLFTCMIIFYFFFNI